MSLRRKQLSFDLDTGICKKILGDSSYTKAYKDIRAFLERNDYFHIEGSVYMSNHVVSNVRVSRLLEDLLAEHPYLEKCIKEIHQADITNIHSLNQYFSYDGTPGRYERQAEKSPNEQKREPPEKPSVREQLEKNKAVIKEKAQALDPKERASPYHNRDLLR